MSGHNDEIARFREDPEAGELSRRLAEADFSPESKVRASLRARLLAAGGVRRPSRRAVSLWGASLAFAALALVLSLRGVSFEKTVFPRGENGLPVLPGRLSSFGAVERESAIESVPGRVVSKGGAISVVWEVGGGSCSLQTRRTSLDEIFQKRVSGEIPKPLSGGV